MSLINKMLSFYCKAKLKKAYLRYRRMLDGYSCGGRLAEYVSPATWRAKQKVNQAIRRCRKYDPSCAVKEIE